MSEFVHPMPRSIRLKPFAADHGDGLEKRFRQLDRHHRELLDDYLALKEDHARLLSKSHAVRKYEQVKDELYERDRVLRSPTKKRFAHLEEQEFEVNEPFRTLQRDKKLREILEKDESKFENLSKKDQQQLLVCELNNVDKEFHILEKELRRVRSKLEHKERVICQLEDENSTYKKNLRLAENVSMEFTEHVRETTSKLQRAESLCDTLKVKNTNLMNEIHRLKNSHEAGRKTYEEHLATANALIDNSAATLKKLEDKLFATQEKLQRRDETIEDLELALKESKRVCGEMKKSNLRFVRETVLQQEILDQKDEKINRMRRELGLVQLEKKSFAESSTASRLRLQELVRDLSSIQGQLVSVHQDLSGGVKREESVKHQSVEIGEEKFGIDSALRRHAPFKGETVCMRCGDGFLQTAQESCRYHPGTYNRRLSPNGTTWQVGSKWSCCKNEVESARGCAFKAAHVG